MAIDQALCRSKARFMYDVPVEHSCAAPLILIFCAIWVLSFLVEFVTHRNMPVENSTPPTAHTRAKQFAINTVLLVLDGFFFAMAVLGLLKTYYCIDEPRWDGWNDDWIAAGFLGGLPLFCALSNWGEAVAAGAGGYSAVGLDSHSGEPVFGARSGDLCGQALDGDTFEWPRFRKGYRDVGRSSGGRLGSSVDTYEFHRYT